jgi:hypothetical protein
MMEQKDLEVNVLLWQLMLKKYQMAHIMFL